MMCWVPWCHPASRVDPADHSSMSATECNLSTLLLQKDSDSTDVTSGL